MKKIIFLSLVLLLLPFFGQARKLSQNAEVYLLTCDPGKDLYSAFGHTAIWVVDSARRIDQVYNYGVFDFDTPNFYTKFTLGKLKYKLDREPFNRFIREYFYMERSVYRQKLILSHQEKQRLYKALLVNYRPENRYYLYDFLFDNCATRVIDIIAMNVDHPVRFRHLEESTSLSFRQNLDKYLKASPWIDFGIDIALGLPADKIMTARQSMFLPDDLMRRINPETEINAETPKLVFEGASLSQKPGLFTPFNIFMIVSVCFLLVYFLKRNSKLVLVLDKLIYGLTGILGLVVLFLWIGTDHQSMQNNLNIFWAMPLNLMVFFGKSFRSKKIFSGFMLCYSILIAILLGAWALSLFPQQYHVGIIPLLFMLMARSGQLYFLSRKNYIN